MKTLSTLSALFAVLLTNSVAQVSYAQYVVSKEGPYSIAIQETGDQLVLSVSHRYSALKSNIVHYFGACKPKVQVSLTLLDPAVNKAFESSGNYDDLNAEEMTGIFTRELSKKCPNITTVEMVLSRMDNPVVASLSKASGWKNTLGKLSAEAAANPADKIREEAIQNVTDLVKETVMFSAQNPFTRIATKGMVECKKESNIYMQSSDILDLKPKSINPLRSFAEAAAPEFKKKCPAVEQIRFRPRLLPKEFECKTDCYLLARLSGEIWTVETVGYEYPSYNEEKIQDFNDIIALMKAGDYTDIRRNYTGYYKQFYTAFLSTFSAECVSYINDPIPIEVSTVEDTFDSNGFKINSQEVGNSYTIYLDRKYSDTFIKYRKANSLRLLGQALTAEADERRNSQNIRGGEGIVKLATQAGAEGKRILEFINQGCKHTDVLSVYKKLDDVLD